MPNMARPSVVAVSMPRTTVYGHLDKTTIGKRPAAAGNRTGPP